MKRGPQTAGTASRFEIPLELNQVIDAALPGRKNALDRYRLRSAVRAIMRWELHRDLHCDRVPEGLRHELAARLAEALGAAEDA